MSVCKECKGKLYNGGKKSKTGLCYSCSRPKKGQINSGYFKKGLVPWCKGTKGVLHNPLKGKKMPESWKAKLRKPKSYVPPMSEETRILHSEIRRGELSHRWRGGITSINQKRRNLWTIRKWKKQVKERDGFRCVLCGSSENLHADHIKPLALYPELGSDLSNGRTLCAKCHMGSDTYGGKSIYFIKQKQHVC